MSCFMGRIKQMKVSEIVKKASSEGMTALEKAKKMAMKNKYLRFAKSKISKHPGKAGAIAGYKTGGVISHIATKNEDKETEDE